MKRKRSEEQTNSTISNDAQVTEGRIEPIKSK